MCVCVIDVGGPADPIAPAIIIPPKNTSVTMGRNEAIMECVANARYISTHTRITEEKDEYKYTQGRHAHISKNTYTSSHPHI